MSKFSDKIHFAIPQKWIDETAAFGIREAYRRIESEYELHCQERHERLREQAYKLSSADEAKIAELDDAINQLLEEMSKLNDMHHELVGRYCDGIPF